jgi:Tol biopolymer transport system component/DNA-binding winged helix-turn-helix (wHTH) protein
MADGPVDSERIVRFGPFETNLRTGEIRKHGIRIRLGGQPVQVLLILLQRPGEVVTRDEIRHHLWTDDTFVEFEDGLNSAVKKLRGALGDSADKPLYVETLPRVGYRFIAPLAIRADGSAAAFPQFAGRATGPQTTPTAAPRTSVQSWYLALGVCLLVAGVAGYGFFSPAPAPRVTSFVQSDISDRVNAFAHLVTDGARVYFLERSGDTISLAETSTAGGEAHTVQGPFQYTRVFDASPDHAELLVGEFGSHERRKMPLWIWPVQGGSPIRVGDILVHDASWTLNGREIVYSLEHDIRVVRRDGTGDRILIHTSGDPGWMRWSPDGRRFTYTVEDPQSDAQTLWEAFADGSHAHVRFPGWSDPPSECCSEWTPDGKYLVFTSSRNGFPNLWAIRERPEFLHWKVPRPVQLTPTASPLWGSLLTRNGARIFAYGRSGRFEVVRYDLGSGRLKPAAPPGNGLNVAFSRDGAWMAFVPPDSTLWRSKEDGSERVQLVGAPLITAWPRWSPDGTKITFEASVRGKPVRAYFVSAAGGPLQEVFAQDGEQSVPTWSPDGERIALALNVDPPPNPSAPRGIYIVDWETRQATKVPGSEGFTSPLWSPDGRYFTAKTADDRAILMFDSRTQKWTPIATGTALSGLTWSPDSKYLYVQKIVDPGEPIYRLHAGDFKPELVRDLQPLLGTSVLQCAFGGFAPDGSLTLVLKHSDVRVYALDVELP